MSNYLKWNSSKDIPEDELIFVIIEPPKHGRIINLGANTLEDTQSIDSFSCMQLKYKEIGYEHDDSENFDDSVKLQLHDGKHVDEDTIKIDIISGPFLKIDACMQILENSSIAEIWVFRFISKTVLLKNLSICSKFKFWSHE